MNTCKRTASCQAYITDLWLVPLIKPVTGMDEAARKNAREMFMTERAISTSPCMNKPTHCRRRQSTVNWSSGAAFLEKEENMGVHVSTKCECESVCQENKHYGAYIANMTKTCIMGT